MIYTFECRECGHVFDHILAVSRRNVNLTCPKCKDIARRVPSFPAKAVPK